MLKKTPDTTFVPLKKDHYLETNADGSLLRAHLRFFKRRLVDPHQVLRYVLTVDGEQILEGAPDQPTLRLDSIFADHDLMHRKTDDGSVYKMVLTIETASDSLNVFFINTRTEVGALNYSMAMLDAENALRLLDQTVAQAK